MMIAAFKDRNFAEKFGLSVKDTGVVLANETRDGEAFLTVQFETVEVNGLPAELFTVSDLPEEGVE
jgi:hypothetical protein